MGVVVNEVIKCPVVEKEAELREQYDKFAKRLLDAGVPYDRLDAVLDVVAKSCKECLNEILPCHCWNDE